MANDLISRSQACEMLLKQQQLTPSVVRRVLLQVPIQEAEKNEPLTLDELRMMDGEPAWFVSLHDGFASWGIVRVVEMSKVWFIAVAGAERAFGDLDGYGKTWLAYRRPPEGGNDNGC